MTLPINHIQAELRVKASDSERERLSIVLAETNVKVDTLEKEVAEGKDKYLVMNITDITQKFDNHKLEQ